MSEWQRHHKDADALCAYVRERTGPTCLLAFSRGKDAIAAAIQVRRYFERVVPYFLAVVPGLRFEEDDLARWEDAFGCEVFRYPHPSFFRLLKENVYQPPGRWETVDELDLPEPTFAQIEDHVRRRSGCPDAWCATGIRAADSMARRANFTKSGSLNPKTRKFHAVFDWTIARLETEIRAFGQPLPIDYRIFGRSFDGIDARFTGPMREHLPEDYARLLKLFPLADLDLHRREISQ